VSDVIRWLYLYVRRPLQGPLTVVLINVGQRLDLHVRHRKTIFVSDRSGDDTSLRHLKIDGVLALSRLKRDWRPLAAEGALAVFLLEVLVQGHRDGVIAGGNIIENVGAVIGRLHTGARKVSAIILRVILRVVLSAPASVTSADSGSDGTSQGVGLTSRRGTDCSRFNNRRRLVLRRLLRSVDASQSHGCLLHRPACSLLRNLTRYGAPRGLLLLLLLLTRSAARRGLRRRLWRLWSLRLLCGRSHGACADDTD
jgi:hypothetical protein